jgi:NTP pyrophosphatase (non-canonical NTP hydrolase)
MNRQEYLLTCLSEEAAEIIQAVGKAQRFGLDDNYIYDDTPKEAIKREFNDLVGVLEMLYEAGVDFKKLHDRSLVEAKKKKVEKYIEYSEKKGTLK